ncbi:MAG: exosortase K [Fibrobacterales bacterium]
MSNYYISYMSSTLKKIIAIALFLSLGKFLLRYMQPDYAYFPLKVLSGILEVITRIPFYWIDSHGFQNDGLNIVIDHSCIGTGFFMLLLSLSAWYYTKKLNIRPFWYIMISIGMALLITMLSNVFRLTLLLYAIQNVPSLQQYKGLLHTGVGVVLFTGMLFTVNHLIVRITQRSIRNETC